MSWSDGPYYDASFGVEKSRRYHAMLRDHYQRVADGIATSNAISGSGAFVAILGSLPLVAGSLTAVVAMGATLDRHYGFAKKAQLHHDLCGRFTDLAADIVTCEPTEANLRKARAKRLRIEKDAPVVKRLVEIMAHCETARGRGIPEGRLPPLSRWQRRFGCFATFGLHRIDAWRAQQTAVEIGGRTATPQLETKTKPPVSAGGSGDSRTLGSEV